MKSSKTHGAQNKGLGSPFEGCFQRFLQSFWEFICIYFAQDFNRSADAILVQRSFSQHVLTPLSLGGNILTKVWIKLP